MKMNCRRLLVAALVMFGSESAVFASGEGQSTTLPAKFLCESLFQGKVNPNSDRLRSNGDSAAKVISALNGSYMPMLQELKARVDRLSLGDVQAILRKMKSSAPVRYSKYSNNVPVLAGQDSIQRELRFNGLRGIFASKIAGYHFVDVFTRTLNRFGFKLSLDRPAEVEEYQDFVWIEPDKSAESERLGTVYRQMSVLITPVGSYGSEFSNRRLRATQLLIDISKSHLRELSIETYARNQNVLSVEAGRTRLAESEASDRSLTPLVTVIEGILSYHQLINATLGEKVLTFDRGEEALAAIVHGGRSTAGISTELTSRVPLDMIGPMSLTGLYFRQPFEASELKGITLSESLKKFLIARKKRVMKNEPGYRGVCPMAILCRGKRPAAQEDSPVESGIQLLAETYLEIFELVSAADDAH